MARKSATGKRPHELTLELFNKSFSLTPTEIEDFVGTGPYAAKHVWFLRKLGHDIAVNKNGRTVVSYTYISGPDTSVQAAAKPVVVKEKKEKVVKAKPASTKKKTIEIEDEPTRNMPMFETKDEVEKTFGTSGAVASYTVDPDWDSVSDVRDLI